MNKKLLIVLLFILVLSVSGWAQETRVLKRYYAIPQTALTNEDIMKLFVNEVRTYLQRYDRIGSYYFVHYGVEQNKELQNDAWHTDTIEKNINGGLYTRLVWVFLMLGFK